METTNRSKNGALTNGHRYAFDNFEIDPANRLLLRDGQVVPLTGKVFDVLLVFAENPGRLLGKDELIEKSSKNIIGVITEIRKLSQSLMIPSLEDLGLLDSIEDLVESINATKKIHAVFVHEKIDEAVLNENQKLTLFRITQEALNNIVRHANATRTTIELSNNKKRVQLTIIDNGKGFDSFSTKKGAGLNNIRNRVYLLSGQLTIDTHPGKGCALVVELPHHRVSQLNL